MVFVRRKRRSAKEMRGLYRLGNDDARLEMELERDGAIHWSDNSTLFR